MDKILASGWRVKRSSELPAYAQKSFSSTSKDNPKLDQFSEDLLTQYKKGEIRNFLDKIRNVIAQRIEKGSVTMHPDDIEEYVNKAIKDHKKEIDEYVTYILDNEFAFPITLSEQELNGAKQVLFIYLARALELDVAYGLSKLSGDGSSNNKFKTQYTQMVDLIDVLSQKPNMIAIKQKQEHAKPNPNVRRQQQEEVDARQNLLRVVTSSLLPNTRPNRFFN